MKSELSPEEVNQLLEDAALKVRIFNHGGVWEIDTGNVPELVEAARSVVEYAREHGGPNNYTLLNRLEAIANATID